MSLVTRLKKSPLGLWLYRRSKKKGWGRRVLRPLADIAKNMDQEVQRQRAVHRSHDQAVEARLAAFEATLPTLPDTTPGEPDPYGETAPAPETNPPEPGPEPGDGATPPRTAEESDGESRP